MCDMRRSAVLIAGLDRYIRKLLGNSCPLPPFGVKGRRHPSSIEVACSYEPLGKATRLALRRQRPKWPSPEHL